jgi:hypothetical protein
MREGHLQYLRQLESDLLERDDDGSGAQGNPALIASRKNEAISCELGIRYPTLQAIMSGKKNIQTTKVNSLIVCIYVRTSYMKSCHISYHM